MQAIEIDARIDEQGEIHIKLPLPRRPGPARVIVLFESEEERPAAAKRHRPSSRLANRGARLHGDDIAPALSPDDWGSLYQ